MRSLTVRVSVTTVAVALASYGIASIWLSSPIASSTPWLWCILLILKCLLLSTFVMGTLSLVLLLLWCKRNVGITHEGAKCARALPSKLGPCPYHKLDGREITCFTYNSDLHLMRFAKGLMCVARKDQYVVAKPYTVSFKLGNGDSKCITVPKGMLSDLSSAPFPLQCIVGRVGPHLEATIVHDYLYVAWQDYTNIECVSDKSYAKECDKNDSTCIEMTQGERRKFADRLMLEGMRESGMGCMAYLIYWGVRIGGGCTFRGKNPLRYVDLGECNCGEGAGCKHCDNDTSDGGSCCECASANA